jgi:hypothetical protein
MTDGIFSAFRATERGAFAMVRSLLIKGMLVGLLAGVLAFAFAWVFGEPQVDLSIAFEDHMHQMAVDAPEPEIVSRALQSSVGLLTGVAVYSCALGGIFALVFAYTYGRIGQFGPRGTAALLAAVAYVVLVVVPQIKYPANPPSIGDPETIGLRTAVYFTMIAVSIIAAVAAVLTTKQFAARLGGWNSTLAGGGVYLLVVAGGMAILPPVNEVPDDFSAVTLWNFRLSSLGIGAVLWTTLGLAFGVLTKRQFNPRARSRLPATSSAG